MCIDVIVSSSTDSSSHSILFRWTFSHSQSTCLVLSVTWGRILLIREYTRLWAAINRMENFVDASSELLSAINIIPMNGIKGKKNWDVLLCAFFCSLHNENWLKRVECLASALETCTHKFLIQSFWSTHLRSYRLTVFAKN